MIVSINGEVTVRPTDDELSGISIGLAAIDGEVGNGTFPYNDALSSLVPVTGTFFDVYEGDATLTVGYMLDNDRTRPTEPQGRLYAFAIMDCNARLDGFRIRRNRPAEYDWQRVEAFGDLDLPDFDQTWILHTNPVMMPAKLYDSDGGWTSELIPDLLELTGKTLFLVADEDGVIEIHYHNLTSGRTCGLTISDVIADVDRVTTWEPWEPSRQQTSAELRNDIKGVDNAGRTAIRTDPASIAAHDDANLKHQVLVSYEADSQSDLNAMTDAELASSKDDLDTYSCQIGPLDGVALGLIRVGDLITVTSDVMGLTASPQRIAHMTLSPAMGVSGTAVPDRWMAALEMGAPKRRRARVRNSAFTNRVTHPPVPIPCDFPGSILVDSFERTETDTWGTADGIGVPWVNRTGNDFVDFDNTTYDVYPSSLPHVTGGSILVPHSGSASGGVSDVLIPSSFILDGDCSVDILRLRFTVTIDDNPIGDPSCAHVWQVGLIDNVSGGVPGSDPYGDPCWVALRWTFDGSDIFLSLVAELDGGEEGFLTGETLDSGETYDIILERDSARKVIKVSIDGAPYVVWDATAFTFPDVDPAAITLRSIVTMVDVGLAATLETTIDNPTVEAANTSTTLAHHWTVYGPAAPQETPDGIITTFTNPEYPPGGYVPNSLRVTVDAIPQNVTEDDPAAGTWSLTWAPEADNEVRATWLVP